MTEPVLAALSRRGEGEQSRTALRCKSYTFTDISPSFFEKAKERFSEHSDRMLFRTLDIEKDPAQQDFKPGSYDMVLAANVLHATVNIGETLRHARSLLKPGGYLILIEVTNKQSVTSNTVWGCLPGWWRATEDDRQWGPLYSPEEWETALYRNGFTKLEIALPDYHEKNHQTLSVLVSRADAPESAQVLPLRPTIISRNTILQNDIARDISTYIESAGSPSCKMIVDPQALTHSNEKNDLCICLLDLEGPFISSMKQEDLDLLKAMARLSTNIFWITRGAGADAKCPEKTMISGFARAIMQEYPGLHITNIEVADPAHASSAFQRIYKQQQQLISTTTIGSSAEKLELRESDYLQQSTEEGEEEILIPRVFPATEINNHVHEQTGPPKLTNKTISNPPNRKDEKEEDLELRFTTGRLDSFHFAEADTPPHHPLGADEVELEVKAAGINFADVMTALGQMTSPSIGYECAGIVRRVGAAVTRFSAGDRVCHAGTGIFRTHVRGRAHTMIRIPDTLAFTRVFPAVYLTALYGIVHLARLEAGESVLIHAAAGAVGQVAIQLAQRAGADVFVTVSSADKRELLRRLYGIPAVRIFYSRNLAFGRRVLQATGGRGVDVVLNSLSGEALAESWRLLAPLGRFVEIGKRDIQTFQSLPMQPFARNVSYHSLDLLTLNKARPSLVARMTAELETMLAEGAISSPQPVAVFSRAEFEPAMRYLQTGHHMGKAVIDWEAEATIPVLPVYKPAYYFDSNASYVIAGGLGGIGQSLASWIAGRGARHLILLSRSGPVSEKARKLVQDLADCGVNVATPLCDVSNSESLEKALRDAATTMPPVKGCIQGSMVLRVRSLLPFSLLPFYCLFYFFELAISILTSYCLGPNISRHDTIQMAAGPQTQSSRNMESPQPTTQGDGLLRHPILGGRHDRITRSVAVQRGLGLPGRVRAPQVVARGEVHFPRRRPGHGRGVRRRAHQHRRQMG